jgi:hypothetical protein
MGASSIYSLPWPELPVQADGPAAFQALANKLDTTLAGLVVPFTQLIGDVNISSGTNTTTLSSVPLGRPVLLIVYANCRITSNAGQYGVYQIFDGTTKVTADTAVQVGSAAGSIVTPISLTVCRTFVATPTLVVTAGSAGTPVITDNIRATGLGFGWPS